MRTPLCMALALGLLLGALALGNPFLRAMRGAPAGSPPRATGALPMATPAAAPAPARPAGPPSATPALAVPQARALAGAGGPLAAPLPGNDLPPLVAGQPDPAFVARVLRGRDGATLWLLNDGRVVGRCKDRDGLELVTSPADQPLVGTGDGVAR